MANLYLLSCVFLGLLYAVYTEENTTNSHSTDYFARNVTSFFNDFHNVSLLQIRSRFPCDIEFRVSPKYGVLVYLEINGSDPVSVGQVGTALDVHQEGYDQTLVLQIDMFPEESHAIVTLVPVFVFSICISVCSVLLYRYRKVICHSRKLKKKTNLKGKEYYSQESIDPAESVSEASGQSEPTNKDSEGRSVKSRARLFEEHFSEKCRPDRDVEKNAEQQPEPRAANIKYLIAKFQANDDDVKEFAPKQHIVGIRYSTTPAETPGGQDKIRKKFFMTSATRRRFISSPLKRLHQHVQAKIRDKDDTVKTQDQPGFKAGRNMRIYQTIDLGKQKKSARGKPFRVENTNKSPKKSGMHRPSKKSLAIYPEEDGLTEERKDTTERSTPSRGQYTPSEVQVSVVYLRSKIIRLLAGEESENTKQLKKEENNENTNRENGDSEREHDTQKCRSILPENQELNELYQLVSALVEPSSDDTDGASAECAQDYDSEYGDVKIYDVRHGTNNDISVRFQSVLYEDKDVDDEDSVYSELNFMTVVDLDTPDVSDSETAEDYYEPVGEARKSGWGVQMRRKSRHPSSRSSQSSSPRQEFLELYDLISTLMESDPDGSKQKPNHDSGDDENNDNDDDDDDFNEVNDSSIRQQPKNGRDSTYVAHRSNIKYLISTFEAKTDEVKDFLPRMGHHRMQCVGDAPPPVFKPEDSNVKQKKKKKNLLMSLFGLLSVLTVAHAVTIKLPNIQKLTVYIHPDIFKTNSGRIELFLPYSYHVSVDTKQWLAKRLPVHVYDVDELPKIDEYCLSSASCPHLSYPTATQVACDGRLNTCICPRGYVLDGDKCVDLDECLTGKHNCHAYAFCENTIGSYTCTCNQSLAVWGDGKHCQLCSVDCPYEHYISKECTPYEDRVCAPCRQCKEDEYEFYGCGTRVNRHCLHPAGSPAILKDNTDDVTYTPVKNTTGYVILHDSETMFGENLHNNTDKSWIYHVSKRLAFEEHIRMVRESGIELELTLHSINLLPKFVETPSAYGAAAYKISGLNQNDRNHLKRFTSRYCRNVVPDFYTLFLKLYRERLSSVITVSCDDSNSQCPEEYNNHGNYSFRSLYDKCPHSDSLPGLTIPHQGVACMNNIPLLTDIFDQTLDQSPVKRFPSESCRVRSVRCERCLRENASAECPAIYKNIGNDTSRERCCKISCYNTKDCRYAYSETCKKIPGDCSQGDVAVFTLLAHVEDIRTLSCSLRYVPPTQLYRYSYRIRFPRLRLESDRKHVIVQNFEASKSTSPLTSEDYLSVSHETIFSSLDEDVILRAESVGEFHGHEFSVHNLKKEQQFTGRNLRQNVIYDKKTDTFRIDFQTSTPFALNKLVYSLQRPDHHCPTDIGQLYDKQPIYHADGIPVTVHPYSDGNTRSFDVIPLDKPSVTFSLKGNQSILRHFFGGEGAHLINDESLEAELDREQDRELWIIKVEGYLSHCPGYIGFIIRDAHALLELIRYDAIVQCRNPPCDPDDQCGFRVEFEIPMAEYGDERFFTLKLLDFNGTYEIFLASVNRTDFPTLPSFEIPDYLFSLPDFPWKLFGGIIALGVAATISLVGILIYAEKKNPRRRAKKLRKATGGKTGWVTGKNAELAKKVYIHSNKLQARHCIFIIWTLIFRIAYACVFSFTAFYFVLLVIHHDDLETIRTLPKFVRELNERNENISRAIDQHREQEIIRQQNHTGQMQQSCDIYIQNLFKKIRRQMAEITLFHRLQMFNIRATVSFNVGELATKEMKEFAWRVGNYTVKYKQKVWRELKAVYGPFAEWLHRVVYNGWFQIGVGLYQVRKHFIEPVFDAFSLPLPAISLMDFLGIDAALDIYSLPRDLLQKIRNGLPALPTFDIPDLDDMFLNFSMPGFLPDDLLHIYIPHIEIPDLEISICPQWDNSIAVEGNDNNKDSVASDRQMVEPSVVDSQRSFVTPFDTTVTQADDVLAEYLKEMEEERTRHRQWEGNSTFSDERNVLRSYDDLERFDIATADHEQQFRDRQRDIAAETEVIYTSNIWEYTRMTLFKMFGVLDVVLLLYRLSKTYVVIVQLVRGFTEIIPQTETEKRIKENKKAAREFEEKQKKALDNDDKGNLDDGGKPTSEKDKKKKRISQQDVRIYIENTAIRPNIFDRHRLDSETEHSVRERIICVSCFCFDVLTTAYLAFINGVRSLIDKAVHTSLVPKLILVGCVCVVTYVIIVIGFVYLTVQSLDELGIYDMLAARLDLNLEYSNLKIWENAAFLENVTMKAYYEQMRQQLANMADIIHSFNLEQAGLISLYENEICSYRREITGKRNCDFKILFRKLEMELLPCQLSSTQPIPYEGYEREAFINETKFDSQPYVQAIRNVIIHTFYAVLVAVALIAVITGLGYALFEYLKSRNMIRVIKIYQMDREEQTYAAIYRSVKRRQTMRRRQRQQRKEEAFRQKARRQEKNNEDSEKNDVMVGDGNPEKQRRKDLILDSQHSSDTLISTKCLEDGTSDSIL